MKAIAPLKDAGKLRLVHIQFPRWLLRNREGHVHVRHCAETMAGHTVPVEFRNKVGFEGEHRASTLAFERDLGVVHTVVDAPQGFPNSVPQVWEVTHPELAYGEGPQTHVVFNNNAEDQGLRNAISLMAELESSAPAAA